LEILIGEDQRIGGQSGIADRKVIDLKRFLMDWDLIGAGIKDSLSSRSRNPESKRVFLVIEHKIGRRLHVLAVHWLAESQVLRHLILIVCGISDMDAQLCQSSVHTCH
jgi:hypothetical protein